MIYSNSDPSLKRNAAPAAEVCLTEFGNADDHVAALQSQDFGMPLVLNVDGKRISEPSDSDITRAFESLDKSSGGFFSGPGLSMIILQYDEANSLTATGTYSSGFMLSHQDGDPSYEFNTDINQPISVDEAINIFQKFARGEDWGQSRFKWERFVLQEKTSRIIKRLLIVGFVGYVAYIIIKHLTN